MARFTSRTFKKYMSRKSRKTRKTRSHNRKQTRMQRQKQMQKGGGDTFSRRIPSQAYIANPPNTSEYRGNDAIGNTTDT